MVKALFRQIPWRTDLITNSRNTCYALLFFTSLSRSLPITTTTPSSSFLASTAIAISRTSLSRPVHLTVQRRRFWLWLRTRGRGAPPVSPSARSQLSLHMPGQYNFPQKMRQATIASSTLYTATRFQSVQDFETCRVCLPFSSYPT